MSNNLSLNGKCVQFLYPERDPTGWAMNYVGNHVLTVGKLYWIVHRITCPLDCITVINDYGSLWNVKISCFAIKNKRNLPEWL